MKPTAIRSIRSIPWLMSMSGDAENPVGLQQQAAMLIEDGKIAWLGPQSYCPSPSGVGDDIDGAGLVAMPGLIDCHTHLVFGGNRINDFYRRAGGTAYADILLEGGGILSTVEKTRDASLEELVDSALPYLGSMLAKGVTTVEVKSGYGLSFNDEIKMLEVVAKLNEQQPVELVPTFLGAHAVPKEYAGRSSDYTDIVVSKMLPEVAKRKLAKFVDVFVEKGAFSVEEGQKIFEAATSLGLACRIHADQLSALGGTRLAAKVGAVSASHLEHASLEDLKELASAGVVAEVLPLAELYLGAEKVVDCQVLKSVGVKVAVATDFNPGSAMCNDLQLAMRLAITHRKMSVEDAMLSVTRHAAHALRLDEHIGQLKVGMRADVCLIKAESPWELAYDWTKNPVTGVIKDGSLVT